MTDARKSDQSQAPGHFENQGPKDQATPRANTDREEQYQSTRDRVPTDTGREDKVRERAYEIWEREGRPEGLAHHHWDRAAQDLDSEEANRQGHAESKP
jgi:hypothetical protein